MQHSTFLGLDLGTSGLRALLVNAHGNIIGEATSTYQVLKPHPRWCEQDASDWIAAIRKVFSKLATDHGSALGKLAGIGISGQMHGAMCVDKDGHPVRPCILWNDTRAAAQAMRLDSDNQFRDITGNMVFPGFTAPKLVWIAEHEVDVFQRIAKVMLPKDFIVHWLTGRYTTEMSDASGTGWLDTGKRDWSDRLLKASGLGRCHVPVLLEGCDVVGTLRTEVAQELHIRAEVCVIAGGADNAVAACGLGVINEGQAFVSLGTSGVLLAAREKFTPAADSAVHTFCHAIPRRWYQMGVILSATDSLNWLSTVLNCDAVTLSSTLPSQTGGPCSIRFLPYLSGERTPHNEAMPKGAFLGLSATTDRTTMTRAVMEGVAFALRDCLEAVRFTGVDITSVMATGGGTKSDFWMDTLAQILQLPVHVMEKGEFGAALGAARLAIVGVGGMAVEQIMKQPRVAATFQSRANIVGAFNAAYAMYKRSYTAIRDLT